VFFVVSFSRSFWEILDCWAVFCGERVRERERERECVCVWFCFFGGLWVLDRSRVGSGGFFFASFLFFLLDVVVLWFGLLKFGLGSGVGRDCSRRRGGRERKTTHPASALLLSLRRSRWSCSDGRRRRRRRCRSAVVASTRSASRGSSASAFSNKPTTEILLLAWRHYHFQKQL